MRNEEWFVMRPQKAEAYGRPQGREFLVRKGSTAMRNGSPNVTRESDDEVRDDLINRGVLVQDANPLLLRFTSDYLFNSPSQACGVIKDGNCSGPGSWRRVGDNKTLKNVRSE